jgi:hypothetical protein
MNMFPFEEKVLPGLKSESFSYMDDELPTDSLI